MTVKWNGDAAANEIREELTRRLHRCAILVHNRAKKLLSLPGTTKAIRSFSYWYGGRKRTARKKGNVYGAVVSQPGEPPRKQLGTLRQKVVWEVVGLVARVGMDQKYGRWLELGTRKMAARPWLRRALDECRDDIRRILTAPMKWK
jgi:hypothetical protein